MRIEQPEDWKRVSQRQVEAQGGRGLLARYKGSFLAALQDAYPEHRFDALRCRPQVPAGYWDSRENRRSFLEGVAGQLGLRSMEDWRGVTNRQLQELGGGRLLNLYSGSLYAALKDLFPEQEVGPGCRAQLPKAYWEGGTKRREFLLALAERHGVREVEEWARVTHADILAMGGRSLLAERSVLALIEEGVELARAEQGDNTDPRARKRQHLREKRAFLFRPTLSADFWNDPDNVSSFIDYAARQLQLSEPREWYRVSLPQLLEVKGARSLLRAMPLLDALRIAHPRETWQQQGLDSKLKKASQRHMLRSLHALFAAADRDTEQAPPCLL